MEAVSGGAAKPLSWSEAHERARQAPQGVPAAFCCWLELTAYEEVFYRSNTSRSGAIASRGRIWAYYPSYLEALVAMRRDIVADFAAYLATLDARIERERNEEEGTRTASIRRAIAESRVDPEVRRQREQAAREARRTAKASALAKLTEEEIAALRVLGLS